MMKRKSIKYKFTYPGQTELLDYVFAESPEDADSKAREHFTIPDDAIITFTRINETGHGHLGTGRKQLASLTGGPIRDTIETKTMEMKHQ